MLYFSSQAGPPRVMAPRGIDMRKVRASQGRITDNVRRRQLPGKCNRNRLPKPTGTVQMERRGKSSPARQATVCKCKPYPMQRLHAGISFGGSCRPGRTAEAAQRRLATTVPDRWRLRSSLRTEPGLHACRKIPFFFFSNRGGWGGIFRFFGPSLLTRGGEGDYNSRGGMRLVGSWERLVVSRTS